MNRLTKNGTVFGESMLRLAKCYRYGRGTKADMNRAIEIVRRAVKKNTAGAQDELDALLASRES